jgi:hypothetical protein
MRSKRNEFQCGWGWLVQIFKLHEDAPGERTCGRGGCRFRPEVWAETFIVPGIFNIVIPLDAE